MTRGIDAAAIYLPRYRITSDAIGDAWDGASMRGIDRKTVAAADEDAATMAVAAGERALDRWDRSTIDTVAIATTRPPLAEDGFGGRMVRALGLSNGCETSLSTGSTRAGAAAITRAFDADGTALVLASDAPRGDPGSADHALGAGAAAFVVDDGGAVELTHRGTHADERPGIRYRTDDGDGVTRAGITGYERGSIRQALVAAFENAGVSESSGVALHQPNGGLPYRMAGALPIDDDAVGAGTVVDRLGDLGAATVPIGLARLLAGDVTRPTAGFFGGGSATVLGFTGGLADVSGLEAIDEGEEIGYDRYLRLREHLGTGEVDGGGARVSLPNWQRSLPQRYRFVAGICEACGALNFPPEGACQACHERAAYEEVELDPHGEIVARTVIGQGGAPPEFAPQQRRDGDFVAAIVRLEHGDASVRIPAQVVDCDAAAIGDAVRATFRRIYTQEGVVRYGRKFVPIA